MKTAPPLPHARLAALLVAVCGIAHAQPPIAPEELVAPEVGISGGNVTLTVQPSVAGRSYKLEYSGSMVGDTWQDSGVVRVGDGNDLVITTPYEPGMPRRIYRLVLDGPPAAPPAPDGFEQIPAGSFLMGDSLGDGGTAELPVHTVQVSTFYMAKYEVTKALWDEVLTWGVANGYPDLRMGGGKAATHPVQNISWYEMVKWCNARSQKEGLTPCYYTDAAQTAVFKTGTNKLDNTMVKWSANGYRLPTEAEWEKAARGGLSGRRFPWGDKINHTYADYYNGSYNYESPKSQGYHPTYNDGVAPYTAPVGNFAANGYGLYDMAGNVWEWCWDWHSSSYYTSSPGSDPRGAATGSYRVLRGGGWDHFAYYCRVAARYDYPAGSGSDLMGFRLVRSSVP
ncbi:MAG: formylglycine-generating enzyme family protein [Verrucomicrobia bacterium]|nr:formylglycine-generating enzyme family protein [Verrucomicrobiota bacterium]